MTYANFIQTFLDIYHTSPTYRLGQHFIVLFIKESSDIEMSRLWEEKDVDVASKMIDTLIERYNWDYDDLPLVKRGG